MVSVIIPSYNSEKTISNCIDSLLNQDYVAPYEIILVDSSDDNTPQIMHSRFPQIQYYHFETKTDPGTARNTGVKISRGDLILFIDSDCIAEREWINKIAYLHQEHVDIAAIGGAALNGNNPKSAIGWASYMSEFREFIPEQPRSFVRHIPTLNISYKKWVFDKYGYFDPYYYPQEDLVYNHTLTAAGERILFDPGIRVKHTHRAVWSDFLKHQQKIGEITAQVLKILPLSGSLVARNKILYPFFGPILPVIKFFKTIALFCKKRPLLLLQHPLAIPILKIGLLYWFYGFSQGVFSEKLRGVQ